MPLSSNRIGSGSLHLTLLGIALLPLSFFSAGQPVRLLQLALVAAVFEAAAAIVIGGFGLQPALVPGLLFVVFVITQYMLGMRYSGERLVFWTLLPLMLFLGYILFSIFVLPDAFAGKVMVVPQKFDTLGDILTPLQYTSGNLTQTLYFASNVAVTMVAALFMTRVAIPYSKIIGAYLLGGYVVVVVAFWELISRVAGVPFPEDALYSNPGWAIVHQAIGSVPRIQATFPEPAALAVYLMGLCLCCLWLALHGHRAMKPSLLLSLSLVAMLLSTSTTAIVCLVIGFPAVLIIAGRRSAQIRGRMRQLVTVLGLGGMLLIGPLLVAKPDLLNSVNVIIDTTMAKQGSESYQQRTTLDEAALQAVTETYGLGVGWGSFRPSSLIPGILANGGIFGLAMLIWLGARTATLASRARTSAHAHPAQILVDGFSAALCGQIAAAVLSSPTITSLAFFLQLGCLIGGGARICQDARPLATAGHRSGPRGGRNTDGLAVPMMDQA